MINLKSGRTLKNLFIRIKLLIPKTSTRSSLAKLVDIEKRPLSLISSLSSIFITISYKERSSENTQYVFSKNKLENIKNIPTNQANNAK